MCGKHFWKGGEVTLDDTMEGETYMDGKTFLEEVVPNTEEYMIWTFCIELVG